MTNSNGTTKGWSAIALVSLLILAAGAAHGQLITAHCGSEEEPACTSRDPAYYAAKSVYVDRKSDAPMECDYGLVKDGAGYCQNSTRRHFPNTNSSILGRQIENQEYSIGADTPINWLSLLGTHNSFSSWNEGAESSFIADQQWSLSDQLQAGARTIMLDVHFYFDEMRVCHNSLRDELCSLNQDGRLYLFAIKEIAYWLKHNPGEFIILRLNNQVDSQYDYLLDGPIEEFLGDRVFRPADFSAGTWPTLRQLRARGKQIIVLSSNNTQWIHSWPTYVVNDAYPKTENLLDCYNEDQVDVRTRKFNQFAYISEDRSGSASGAHYRTGDLYAGLFPLLHTCGFSMIDVDFLYALSRASVDPQSDDHDDRPQASVWSMASGVSPDTQMPMVMANLKLQPGNKNDVHPFACAGTGFGADQGIFPAIYYPANHDWKITKVADVWKAGETACQKEFGSTYHFWAPGTGIEYGTLAARSAAEFETAPFWVNYFGGGVLTGTPNTLAFRWNKTQAFPGPQRMILRGGRGGALHPSAGSATDSQPFFTNNNIATANSNTVSVAIDSQLASSLSVGTYTQTLQVDETDPATGQVSSTRFPITLQVTDTLQISSSVVDLANCSGPQKATVFVKSGGSFTIEAKDSWVQVGSSTNTAPAMLTITADVSGLSPGTHTTYVKLTAPDTTNQSVVLQVNLTISPQTIINSSPDTTVSILVDGQAYAGVNGFCWAAGSRHTVAATLSDVFAPGTRWEFSSWSDGGAASHTITQPNSGYSLTAHYALQYHVSAAVNSSLLGSVHVSPPTADGYYAPGTQLTVTAMPTAGYHFSDFVVNGTRTATNPLVFLLQQPTNIATEFAH